jgi:hypothetical protein
LFEFDLFFGGAIASLAFPDLAVTLPRYFRPCRAIVEGLGLVCNIKRADDSASIAIKDIDVDHGGFDIFGSEEFLDGANVVAVLGS